MWRGYFETLTEAEIFGHSIHASHYIYNGENSYTFLLELDDESKAVTFGGYRVDAVYNYQEDKFVAWCDWEYCGNVSMCNKAIKLELKIV